MTRKNLSLVIAFGFIALIGIISVQMYWIQSAYAQNKIRFEQNLNKALNQIANDISRQENVFFGFDALDQIQLNKAFTILNVSSDTSENMVWNLKTKGGSKNIDLQISRINVQSNEKNEHKKINVRNFGNNITITQEIKYDSSRDKNHVEKELKVSAITVQKKDSLLSSYQLRIDSIRKLLDKNDIHIFNEQEKLSKTMEELFVDIQSVTHPFGDRIPADKLQNSIERAIKQYDLPKIYAYAVKNEITKELKLRTDNFGLNDFEKSFSISLFPQSFVPRSDKLFLIFPKNNPLFEQMVWPISLVFIFTIILLISLLIIVNNLLHHKKLSAIKSDFINNMTHEFKTPISTIQLASDSVMNEQILHQPERIGYFIGMIKRENKRMNALVERILQMAQLEKKSFDLIKTEVDIHQLIEAVAETAKLKIEEIEGKLVLDLRAEHFIILIDEMHFTNVLFNIIDNAIKYSSNRLILRMESSIKNKQFVLSIQDNGQGMSKETMSHIFDKFYRLTDGNVHTIKGYGLGLSYVKTIISKHYGSVLVTSEPGAGSKFEIRLPLN
jgi:two-component system phosphate regulon sensor histidine kinase PhoR